MKHLKLPMRDVLLHRNPEKVLGERAVEEAARVQLGEGVGGDAFRCDQGDVAHLARAVDLVKARDVEYQALMAVPHRLITASQLVLESVITVNGTCRWRISASRSPRANPASKPLDRAKSSAAMVERVMRRDFLECQCSREDLPDASARKSR